MDTVAEIRKQLETVTGIKQKNNEADIQFTGRLMSAIAQLTDAEWEQLDEMTQQWYNSAAEIVNSGGNPPPLGIAVIEVEEEPKVRVPSTKRRKKYADDDPVIVAQHMILRTLITQPEVSDEELAKKMEDAGVPCSVNNFRVASYFGRLMLKLIMEEPEKETKAKKGKK